jgi:hypothetical protein
MFFKRHISAHEPNAGETYERNCAHNMIERATIIWVGEDCFGIPHVRYRVTIPGLDSSDDLRVLARDVFQQRYRLADTIQAA